LSHDTTTLMTKAVPMQQNRLPMQQN
jgi:hypothetical protein